MFARHVPVLAVVSVILLAGANGFAQSAVLDLPAQSQQSTVMQRIGITDITINYHRPRVKGRTIWGKLVPYGEVWRAGANENTTIAFTDPVTIEGKPLAAGTYGLHMVPNENEWTIIFSKVDTAWGSFTYKEAYDALRVKVKPQVAEFHEALTYDFDDLNPESTVATLRWEKLAVPFKIGVNVHDIVQASLKNQLQGLAQYYWESWDYAANYMLAEKYNLDTALKLEEVSIKTEPRYDNYLTKSNILDAMGKKDDAEAAKKQALALATAPQLYFYGRQLPGEKKQDEAFTYFRQAAQKDPNNWLVHDGVARIYSAQGNWDAALKEMKLSLDGAPDNQKIFVEPLVKKLEAKQDVNLN